MFQRLGFIAAAATFALVSSGTAVAAADVASPGDDAKTANSILDIAHRGAAGYAPENTLAAIDEAAEREATTAEIDVQRSKDGELVVMHDTTLERTTDVEDVFPDRAPYDVGDFTLKELKQLDAGSWFDSSYADERIPTLQQALDQFHKHDLNLFLEIKSPGLYPGIESDIVQTLTDNPRWLAPSPPNDPPRLTIQSFNWDSVQRSHSQLSTIPHGLLGTVPEDEIENYADWADMINPNHTEIDAEYVRSVHDADMDVMTYTVNEPDDMRTALDKGVDGLISDYPDIARKVISEHEKERTSR